MERGQQPRFLLPMQSAVHRLLYYQKYKQSLQLIGGFVDLGNAGSDAMQGCLNVCKSGSLRI